MDPKITRACVLFTCLAGLTDGCSAAPSTVLAGMEQVVHLSKLALSAYQAGDDRQWRRVVCGADNDKAPLVGIDNMRTLVGGISNVQLIALSAGSHAGNAGIDLATPDVRYQVDSTKYPLKELVLTFYMTGRADCVGLGY